VILDLLCAAIGIGFAIAGAVSGFVRQVLRLVAFIGAYAVAGPVAARFVTPALVDQGLLGRPYADLAGVFVSFVLAYAVFAIGAALAGHFLAPPRGALKFADRTLGTTLGLAKGMAIVYVALCGAIVVAEVAAGVPGPLSGLRFDTEGSRAGGFARRHNVLLRVDLPGIVRLATLSQRLGEAARRAAALKDPALAPLAADARVTALLDDPAIAQALRAGRLFDVAREPRVRALLDDPLIAERLRALKLDSLR